MLYLGLFVLLCLTIYFMPVKFLVKYEKQPESHGIQISIVSLFGLLRIKRTVDFADMCVTKEKLEASPMIEKLIKKLGIHDWKDGLDKYRKRKTLLHRLATYFLSGISIDRFDFDMTFGLEDVFETGILFGSLSALFGAILSLISNYTRMDKPKVQIIPCFVSTVLQVDFDCIIQFKTGHIINTGIKALRLLLADRKRQKMHIREARHA